MTKDPKTASAMAALLADDTTPPPPKPGELVSSIVTDIKKNNIVVEINGAYTGIIQGRETIDGLDTAKTVEVGDELSAYVVEDENEDGYFVLSLRKAGREKAWDKLAKMVDTGETVQATIKEANKGGLMTEVSGIRAFIPVSQLSPQHYPRVNGANAAEILSRLQKYIGEKFTVAILAAEQSENKLILSEKAAGSAARSAALQNLKPGKIVKGKVTGVVNFGIFIMFEDDLEGLVHLSEIAWDKVVDPANYARVGEEKEAVVIGIEGDKISLSMKRLTKDPWLELVAGYSVGDEVAGKVARITPYGALVEVAEGLQGLVHISEISSEAEGTTAEVDLEEGQEIKAKIIEIDEEEHRFALSIKALESEAEEK